MSPGNDYTILVTCLSEEVTTLDVKALKRYLFCHWSEQNG